MRYLNFDDIRAQQNQVIHDTESSMPGVREFVSEGTTALLAVLYETAKLSDIGTHAGSVQSYAWLWIYKSVYTIVASLTCAESGFYAESISLNRSLCENLVQTLYLSKFPDDVVKLPSIGNAKRRKLSFSSMFKAIAPGYYETSYNFSSEFLHPGLASNLYKIQREADGSGSVDQGVIFKPDPLSHCFNKLSMLILGFLRSFPIVYPKLNLNEKTFEQWNAAVSSLQSVIDSHIKIKGGPNEWHRLSEPLWNPSNASQGESGQVRRTD